MVTSNHAAFHCQERDVLFAIIDTPGGEDEFDRYPA